MTPPRSRRLGRKPNRQVPRKRDTRRRNFRLELDFRRAVQHVPRRHRPGLRHLLRRLAGRRPARTFYHLDPATGHWHRL